MGNFNNLSTSLFANIAQALDWLKSNYWEPQKNAIPDVRVEIRTRLREMAYYLKIKNVKKSSLEIKGNRKYINHISGKRPVL